MRVLQHTIGLASVTIALALFGAVLDPVSSARGGEVGPAAPAAPAGPVTPFPPLGPKGKPAAPTGATAKCKDGTYSHSKRPARTCAHHGGVAEWLDGSHK